MTPEQFFLANAYLDDELTPDERAGAEGDPEVMAGVAQLRALQAQIRDVPTPSAEVREAAISAAMREFRVEPTPTAPPVVRFRPRPAYARFLAVAAAVVVVGMLGLVLARAPWGGGDGDDAETAVEAPADAPADAPATEPAFTGDDDATRSADVAQSELADEGGAALEAADAPAEEAAEEAADVEAVEAEPPAEAAADEEEVAASDGAGATRPTYDPGGPLESDEQLGAFGADLRDAEDDRTLGPTPNTDCPTASILGSAVYLFDGVPTDVLVAIDRERSMVLAVDPDTCAVLTTVPLLD